MGTFVSPRVGAGAVAADAVKGLLAISPDKKITPLTDKVGSDPIRYADAVIVAGNGKIYVSDASARFAPARWGGTFDASVLDILEQSSTGRILDTTRPPTAPVSSPKAWVLPMVLP